MRTMRPSSSSARSMCGRRNASAGTALSGTRCSWARPSCRSATLLHAAAILSFALEQRRGAGLKDARKDGAPDVVVVGKAQLRAHDQIGRALLLDDDHAIGACELGEHARRVLQHLTGVAQDRERARQLE